MNYMKEALSDMKDGINNHDGGPFGAIITDKEGNIICSAHNEVLKTNDPTMHAEINAIRKCSSILKTHDLSECILYTTCYPCPMCMAAIMWASIKEVYYACSMDDADKIGFSDKNMYDYFKKESYPISLKELKDEECIKAMENYKGELY